MKQPNFGPGFQNIDSRLYRLEYAALLLVILGYTIFYALQSGANPTVFWLSVIFWAILPDLASFVPIGLRTSRATKEWPSWGATVYNMFHNMIVWGILFGVSGLLLRSWYIPLLGWLGHICADRAVGYYLRGNSRAKAGR